MTQNKTPEPMRSANAANPTAPASAVNRSSGSATRSS